MPWSDGREPGADGVLPPAGETVDLSSPSWTHTMGAAELGAICADHDFHTALRAHDYAPVIEIPTSPWIACDTVKFGLDLS